MADPFESDAPPPGSPVVDVLMPAYNAETTIVSAVASMQAQTLRDIRIVVVDDGSTDRTGGILAGMAAADPRILVVSKPNGGIVDALNTGLAHCTARYIARHDADDLAFPDRLEKQIDYLDRHPDCVAVGGNAWHIDETGARIGSQTNFKLVLADMDGFPAQEPYLLHPMLMIRRDVMQQAGGYRSVFYAEDSDLYWRILPLGRLHNLPDLLGEYRFHSSSISGASVLNGRIMALSSQLGAISARRRREGRRDLDFPADMIQRYRKTTSLQEMLALHTETLDAEENRYLLIATAGKLLELASYRPYKLEASDIDLIGDIYKNHHREIPLKMFYNFEKRYMNELLSFRKRTDWTSVARLRPSPRIFVKAGKTRIRALLKMEKK